MQRWLAVMLLTLYLAFPKAYAGETELAAALHRLETLHGFEADPELKALIPAFYALPVAPGPDTIRRLFDEQRVAQWPSRVADFIGLADILFEGMSPDEQDRFRDEFISSRELLLDFQKDITRYVRAIHPGFVGLGLTPLQAQHKGQGIRIVVFDVFEMDKLEDQRRLHPQALIDKPPNGAAVIRLFKRLPAADRLYKNQQRASHRRS